MLGRNLNLHTYPLKGAIAGGKAGTIIGAIGVAACGGMALHLIRYPDLYFGRAESGAQAISAAIVGVICGGMIVVPVFAVAGAIIGGVIESFKMRRTPDETVSR